MTAVGIVLGVVILVAGFRALQIARNRRRYAIQEIPGFLSEAECDHLIERATPLIRESKVVHEGVRGSSHEARRSGTAFLDQAGDAVLHQIKSRIAELTGTRLAQQERTQITHYLEGEGYGPHFDSLRASKLETGPPGDRLCTVILYLNDDYEGGATRFARIARRVRPEKGKAVYFQNLLSDGKDWDPLALHTGETVRSGEKWISNQWIRERDRNPTVAQGGRGSGVRGGGKRRKHGKR